MTTEQRPRPSAHTPAPQRALTPHTFARRTPTPRSLTPRTLMSRTPTPRTSMLCALTPRAFASHAFTSRASVLPALLLSLLLFAAAPGARAQEKPAQGSAPQAAAAKPAAQAAGAIKAAAVTAASTPAELARAAFEAQGGERARAVKNMILLGSVDLYSPNSTQSISGKFGVITAGDRVRQEVQSPFFNVSMIYDGERTYSSMPGFEMPPASKFGLPVLLKFDREGYAVTALPDRKKQRAFRITGPEGNATDFYIDPATARLARYEIPWGDHTFVTEFKNFKEQDGVLVPTQFVQRLDSRQGSFIAEFKVKEAKFNQDLPADAFAIPNK